MRIKIGIRHNLFYPMMAIIFSFFRDLVSVFIDNNLKFNDQSILTLVIFLSEFFSGAYFYKRQKKFLSKSTKKNEANIPLIDKYNSHNNKLRLHLLLLADSFFVLAEFLITTNYFKKVVGLSKSLDTRLRSILTFWTSFFCFFLLKMPIAKHQLCSLLIIIICLILIIALEAHYVTFYYKMASTKFIQIIGLNLVKYMFSAILEVNQKYLLDYEFLNPFFILMIEGIYGIILTLIFFLIVEGSFILFKIIYLEHKIKLIYLIIFLILYFIFCGGRSIYRLMTNKIYSPMAKTFIDCFFVPLLIILYYFIDKDFKIGPKGEQYLLFFILNLILSIIVVFCSCVYNELFILYCCNLEYNTFYEISKRACTKDENFLRLATTNKFEIKDGSKLYYFDYENNE